MTILGIDQTTDGASDLATCGDRQDLFLRRTRDARHGLNRVAITVRDIHEGFGGGLDATTRRQKGVVAEAEFLTEKNR